MVRPLPLPLETTDQGVVPFRLLGEAHRHQPGVAGHQVAGDERHLDGRLPVAVLLLPAAPLLRPVGVLPLAAPASHPGHGALELLAVVNRPIDATDELRHVDRLHAHAQVVLEERGFDDRAGDPHGDAAHRQIRCAAHGGDGQASAREAQEALLHVRWDGAVVRILHVPPVDAEGGQPFLGVGGQHRGQVDGAGPLRPVEPPHGLRDERVHVHRLGAVAPAGRDGDGNPDPFPAELLGATGGFRGAADRRVRDHHLDGEAAGVAQSFCEETRRGPGHAHRLLFERLADAAAATVDRRADPDLRQGAAQAVGGGLERELRKL